MIDILTLIFILSIPFAVSVAGETAGLMRRVRCRFAAARLGYGYLIDPLRSWPKSTSFGDLLIHWRLLDMRRDRKWGRRVEWPAREVLGKRGSDQ